MVRVRFTSHLQRFFPDLALVEEAEGRTVAAVIADLDRRFPGLAAYIVNEHGGLRPHVNVFLGEEMIQDRKNLGDPVGEDQQIFIFQALSGG